MLTGGDGMEKENQKSNYTGCLIVFFIILVIIFIIIAISMTSNTSEEQQELNHENELISQGKIKNASEVITEVAELLKNRDITKFDEYLSNNFSYIGKDNYESKTADNLFNDLQYLASDYDVEKRENDFEDKETYRIYWNTNKLVTDKTNNLYSLQKITVVLNRVVKEDIITYEIEKIILTDN